MRITKPVWQIYLKKNEIGADIYHFYDPQLMSIYLLLKYSGKQIIYEMHKYVPKQNLSKSYIHSKFLKPLTIIIATPDAFYARQFWRRTYGAPFFRQEIFRTCHKSRMTKVLYLFQEHLSISLDTKIHFKLF